MHMLELKLDRLFKSFSEIFKFLLKECYDENTNLTAENYLEKILDIIRIKKKIIFEIK